MSNKERILPLPKIPVQDSLAKWRAAHIKRGLDPQFRPLLDKKIQELRSSGVIATGNELWETAALAVSFALEQPQILQEKNPTPSVPNQKEDPILVMVARYRNETNLTNSQIAEELSRITGNRVTSLMVRKCASRLIAEGEIRPRVNQFS